MKTYLKQSTQDEREELARKVGSSVAYFYQISGGHKKPGPKLCQALVAAEPKFSLSDLRPDYWKPDQVMFGRRSTDRRKT